MQYLTAYGALIWLGQIAKGDFVVITAASSSVGIAAIAMVKVEAAISIAVTRTAAKKAELLKLGADHVVVTDEDETGIPKRSAIWPPVGSLLEKYRGPIQLIRWLISCTDWGHFKKRNAAYAKLHAGLITPPFSGALKNDRSLCICSQTCLFLNPLSHLKH